jgi:hypothetical protein
MRNIKDFIKEQDNSSPRGRSLENDFKRLINDERFYDIALKCSDGMIYGCKAILATRSDVFNSSIFNESVECNNILSFDDINLTAMKVILEFLYTSKVEGLTVDNIIEIYYASKHFELIDLQDHIIEFTKPLINEDAADIGKKLLSECVEKFSYVDNEMSRILVQCVAKNKLEKSKIDSLSLEGLRYLLEKTSYTQIPFATSEFNIWEYSLMKAIRKVIQNETLVKGILDKSSFSECNSQEIKGIKDNLSPLISYINLNRMDVEEIRQHVEPFNTHTTNELKDVYRSIAENEEWGFIRGLPVFRWRNDNMDDTIMITIYNDGFTVETVAPPKLTLKDFNSKEVFGAFARPISILGDLIFKGRGVYEWNILIEKMCKNIYIGVSDINENISYSNFSLSNFSLITTDHHHGWVLGSDGYVYHEKQHSKYNAKFNEGDKITVHLDMKNRTCAFSINNVRKSIVSEWKNIPPLVRPIVSLGHGSKVTIIY